MPTLIPLPTTRVSNLLIRERLLSQLQGDQLDIFRLQNQVSTGRRIVLPSEDPPAAQRAMTLQRLLERKTQLRSSVNSGLSVLGAADSALGDVATALGAIRADVLAASSTTATDETRRATIETINATLQQLVDTANKSFNGRYLFTGSQLNVKPYELVGGYVRYNGNEKTVRSFSDLDVLFSTNSAGTEVFGGISDAVIGGVPLNPQVNADTPLSSLRGGRGISPNGALLLSDGTNTSTVDLSQASTVGDVARLIEENAPPGRSITVTITATGLNLALDASGGGSLKVIEVGTGETAHELQLHNATGVIPPATLVGGDLDPAVLPTTRLSDMLGAKARARVISSGENNDLLLEAAANGTTFNGVTVQFVDDELLLASPGLSAGNERVEYSTTARAARASLRFAGAGNDLVLTAASAGTAYNDVAIIVQGATGIGDTATASYNATNKRLTITVDDAGATTVQSVIDAIDTEGTFTAAHDNSVEASLNPAQTIGVSDVGTATGNTGNSGGAAKTLYVFIDEGVTTANHVAAAINDEGTFTAALDHNDSEVPSLAGTGLVSINATAATSGGSGAVLDASSGIRVVNAGQAYNVTFEDAETVEDVLNKLNASDAGLHAEINAEGTAINVRSRISGADFQIGENGGTTAAQLGIRSVTGATRLAQLNYGVGVPANGSQTTTINKTDVTLHARDGQTWFIDLSSATTAADVISRVNFITSGNVTAQPDGNGGIELVDNTFGPQNLFITQAGNDLAIAGGVQATIPERDFTISTRSGQQFNVDVSDLGDVDEVLAAINAASGGAVTARLAAVGNGIELVDNTVGANQLTVTRAENSQAAEYLGLIPAGSDSATTTSGTLTGTDRNYYETASVFTTLIRLRDALQANDPAAAQRIGTQFDADIDRVAFAQADLGTRERALELSARGLEDEDVQLQKALSNEIDVDLVEAISNLVARQASMQASLQTTATILRLSLLDFL